MSAYDDLAFAGARRHEARPMRCAACDEDVNHLLPDTDECPVCGGPLSERVVHLCGEILKFRDIDFV